ncbi:hypothetical protein [Sinomonas atrocyanea]|uniref:hypothetical protein n=1 Tax=Sinomonas atrocyanea TaxID=37927 RepID=UPI00277E03F1|nr:hypothetical protein [Sinomonas atrocyanea]MDQ0259547.1 hypothetical protein [Sinomonas atrocyanea]MDR6623194.1 hypothetical protein [Sinomonas atrocyanea]
MSPVVVTDLDFGQYVVVTESASVYILDIGGPESSTLNRMPAGGPVGDYDAAVLRRDGETVPLLGILRLEMGLPAVFLIDVRGDGVPTVRGTTPVAGIERLEK